MHVLLRFCTLNTAERSIGSEARLRAEHDNRGVELQSLGEACRGIVSVLKCKSCDFEIASMDSVGAGAHQYGR